MMVSANIPFNKLENPHFKNFIEKYAGRIAPSETTLRKGYLMSCYENVLHSIREEISDNNIWVSVDETSDSMHRSVANVVVGILNPQSPGKRFLLTSELLERVNHKTISSLFEKSMSLLWPDGIKRGNVLLLVTDGASYMIKAAKEIQQLYPKLTHVTCLAHCLHRVAEKIRSCFSHVDCFISYMKKIFLKSPSRTRIFKEMAPEIPLPPKPTVTRWGTWLYAAIYYGKYYNRIVEILNVLDHEDSTAIKEAKCLVSNQLLIDLQLIANKFQDLSKTITLLQSRNMEMIEAIRLVEGLSTANIQSEDEKIVSVQQKFKNILKKNVGFSRLCEIRNKITNPIDKALNSIDSDCDSVTWFKFAPTTSCDVERTFSQLKNCLSENRRSFSFDNLRIDSNLTTAQFADDVAVLCKDSCELAANKLQQFLHLVDVWCSKRKVKMNPRKSNVIQFTYKETLKINPSLYKRLTKMPSEALGCMTVYRSQKRAEQRNKPSIYFPVLDIWQYVFTKRDVNADNSTIRNAANNPAILNEQPRGLEKRDVKKYSPVITESQQVVLDSTENLVITKQEVAFAVSKIAVDTAPGPDHVLVRALKDETCYEIFGQQTG
ncbi:hypothetical protein ANN_00837 [Periplaneta americana]|uniref:DUF659 domain-containing protein n=1 Tax=Periplaneta americana TaxID=6978 RepID=A0ABQ8TSZ9_PERAM|nr:hypothetical protein ANN_00837 [Periplaneta americana]